MCLHLCSAPEKFKSSQNVCGLVEGKTRTGYCWQSNKSLKFNSFYLLLLTFTTQFNSHIHVEDVLETLWRKLQWSSLPPTCAISTASPQRSKLNIREPSKTTWRIFSAKGVLGERGESFCQKTLTESPLSFSGIFFPKRAKNDGFV